MKNEIKFIHHVTKGSRYNQIYIPKEYKREFNAGDSVEVRLLSKNKIFASKNVKLSSFKRLLIEEIFDFLSKRFEIGQIFIFGSFLTMDAEYNDIDIMVVVDEEKENLERQIYDELLKKFNLKFHVICIEKDKLFE